MPKAILLYDGECGFCDRVVQWILRRDRQARFSFAPLQSGYSQATLKKHGLHNLDLSTMVLIVDPETSRERVVLRGRAAFTVLSILGSGWQIPAILRYLPTGLLDWGYRIVARNRFRIGGRLESCRIPTPEQRSRFLDMPK